MGRWGRGRLHLESCNILRVWSFFPLVLGVMLMLATALPALFPNTSSIPSSTWALGRVGGFRQIIKQVMGQMTTHEHCPKLVEKSLKQQQKLQHMLANMPSGMREDAVVAPLEQSLAKMLPECFSFNTPAKFLDSDFKIKDEPVAAPKKGKGAAPRWFISTEELDSLSSYMRGRLTLEKVNIAINEVATYADANAHLVACPKKKLSEDTWEKALELRDIAATEAAKGKHFFLEADIKGPGLKLDHTGKSILTVLRHLGRIHETRIGHHRVFVLAKQR